MKKHFFVFLLFIGLISCSSDDGDSGIDGLGDGVELTPNNYLFEATAGSVVVKAEKHKVCPWYVSSVQSIVNGDTITYTATADLIQHKDGLVDINIDWFAIEVKEQGNSFTVYVKENESSMERKLDIIFSMYNNGARFLVTQKGKETE